MIMTEERSNHLPHIGIVAGTADGAASASNLCHEAERRTVGQAYPEITMHALPLEAYLASIDAGDWAGVAALISRSASLLAHAGAEPIICPNNTLHCAFDLVVSPVPWVHIAAAVAAEAIRRNYRRVGLLGAGAGRTQRTGSVYQPIFEHRGIEILLPPVPTRIELDRIIRTELIRGHYLARSWAYVQDLISTMAASGGVDAVILGCTSCHYFVRKTSESSALTLRACWQLRH